MPYPLPETALHERVKSGIKKEWRVPDGLISDHMFIFDADFSETKMKFAILKGQVQSGINKKFGKYTLKPWDTFMSRGVRRSIKKR